MSNSLAIATVTATLGELLRQATSNVTTLPLSALRNGTGGNQLNLCLYHLGTVADRRWPPGAEVAGPNGNVIVPLPLTLSYLVTAFADDDPNSEIESQILLGEAIRILHDHPVLDRDEIRAAAQGFARLRGSDLHQHPDRIRITLQPLTEERISRLWSAFQTGYRLSVAYEVSAVFIDSVRKGGTALPVLSRGPQDEGPVAEVFGGAPVLEKIELPHGRGSALVGETLVLKGENLGDATRVSFGPLGGKADLFDAEPGGTAEEARFLLTAARVPRAGFYTVSLGSARGAGEDAHTFFSNTLSFGLAPMITGIVPFGASAIPLGAVGAPLSIVEAKRDGTGKVWLAISFDPPVLRTAGKEFAQPVRLLFAGRELAPEAKELSGNNLVDLTPGEKRTLLFVLPAAKPGVHLLRLRVAGVDTAVATGKKISATSARERLEFSDTQKVRVTP